MNFIESSKTKILRLVGNGLIVAASFVTAILFCGSLFFVSQHLSGEELVDAVAILIVSISLYIVVPLIILILGVIGLFKKNVAINMVTGVFSILYGLLLCLFLVGSYLIIIPPFQLIGGILTVVAAVNLNREKTLYETNVLGYQQPSVSIYPQPGIRQPFPTPQPPMSQSTSMPQRPMSQPTPMPQQPMFNNQPQQPFSQPVVNQPNNNIDHSQEQLLQPNPIPQRPTINNQPQQPVSQPLVNQPTNNVDNSQEQ